MAILLDEYGNVISSREFDLQLPPRLASPSPEAVSSSEAAPVKIVVCSNCHAQVPAADYVNHCETCSPENQSRRPNLRPSAWGTPDHPCLPCRLCGRSIEEHKLTTHLVAEHRDRLPEAAKLHNISLSTLERMDRWRSSVLCPVCYRRFSTEEVHAHIRRRHPDFRKKPGAIPGDNNLRTRVLVNCPECQAQVRSDRLQSHIQRIHWGKPNRHPKKHKHTDKPRTRSVSTHSVQVNQLPNTTMGQAFREAFEDTRDGSKYLGYMTRENGRFGSHPLFDDYGDESDAE